MCTIFDSISSNIDEVLSINPSANVFVFGDFNVNHRDWLTYSSGTDRPGEVCYNFSISNDLTEMVNFPTRIPDCDSHSPALLDLFISSDASICSTMAFAPLGNSDHVVYRYYFGRCSSELAQLVPLPFSRGRSTRYSDGLHDFSVTIPRCYKDVHVNSFFPCTAKLWTSLPIECFRLTYDLSDFKSRINRHLLTEGSF